jgi:hypothetical protein
MINSMYRNAVLSSIAVLCIVACCADLLLLYIFGNQIPGYSQLADSISSLGVSSSPVSLEVTIWSVLLGLVFILFAYSFREVFRQKSKSTLIVFWLIVIYGCGEGIASGILKPDHINGLNTITSVLHDILGGIGDAAILLVPLAMIRIFPKELFPVFFIYSLTIWVIAMISIILFLLRIVFSEVAFFNSYSGLWQRIFLIIFYIYFTIIALMIVKEIKNKTLIT